MAESGPQPAKKRRASARRRERVRLIGGLLAGALITAFAAVNVGEVEVNWLVGTWSTPLIVVIAVAAAFGAALDRLLQVRSKRRAKRPSA